MSLEPPARGSLRPRRQATWPHLGDARVRRIDGPITVGSLFSDSLFKDVGATIIGSASGDLRVRTVNGDLRVDQASGDTLVRSANGDVRIIQDVLRVVLSFLELGLSPYQALQYPRKSIWVYYLLFV